MLPYFFRHYDHLVSRYVIYDHDSTDDTPAILDAHPRVERRRFVVENNAVCVTAQQMKNEAWKESRGRADLVLVCDVDEILYRPRLSQYIQDAVDRGVTLFRPQGWEIVAKSFPTHTGQLYDMIKRGFRSPSFDKLCLFNPNAIDEINYEPGAHAAIPTGKVVEDAYGLKLLHHKYMGPEYLVERYAALGAKLQAGDIASKHGAQYLQTPDQIREMFGAFVTEQVVP